MKNNGIIRFMRGNEKNIQKDCFLWNTVAGLFNAAQAVVMMMIITRTDGVEASGILSIAFAMGNLLMTIGKFGVRNYQVTDVKKENTFNSYMTMRIITTLLMFVVSIIYIMWKRLNGNYSFTKAGIVLAICSIYVVESFEDVFLGYYQEEGRLDIGSKVFVVRWFFIMLTFAICAVAGMGLFVSVTVALMVSIVVEIVLLNCTRKLFELPKIQIETGKISILFKNCTALFLAAFLTYYVTNAPKYAIDQYLTEEIQAYFGYISMPVFVVELLNCFLYQPQMVMLANNWEQKEYVSFNKRVLRQIGLIIILTIICVIGAYILGIPVLSMLYGVDLNAYKNELIVLMVAGGALAFVGYTSVLLTIMRKQNILLGNMVIISVAALVGFGWIVREQGMMGAAKYYLLLMFVLAILNYCCTIIIELKTKENIRKRR